MNDSKATTTPVLSPVQFHNDTIYSVSLNGQPYTPVKPIIENIGLAWNSQFVKLKNETERWNCCDIITVASDGKNREMTCIPVRKVAGFLHTVQASRVKKEIKDKLIQYQNECDDVLWDYWTTGQAVRIQPQETQIRKLTERQLNAIDEVIYSCLQYWNKSRLKIGFEAYYKTVEKEFGVKSIFDIPSARFDDVRDFITDKYQYPSRSGMENYTEHCPSVVDDFLQYVLFRIDGILDDLSKVSNETARYNITIELNKISACMGLTFPVEMQFLQNNNKI